MRFALSRIFVVFYSGRGYFPQNTFNKVLTWLRVKDEISLPAAVAVVLAVVTAGQETQQERVDEAIFRMDDSLHHKHRKISSLNGKLMKYLFLTSLTIWKMLFLFSTVFFFFRKSNT